MAQPGFWDNPEHAREIIERSQDLKEWTEPWTELSERVDDLLELAALLEEEPDEELAAELDVAAEGTERGLGRLEFRNMLRDPDAKRDALLTIHPGAGGTESQDWAEMLLRMYSRWAEGKGFDVEMVDLLPGDEAGIKSATLEIKGDYAYGYLVAERGVHRLVRISPFDAASRRHTSFASVFVYPVVEDDIEVEIDEEDLRIDTYRASGAGGQHVNKTSSAVRITHLPTGVVVSMQDEKSQLQNKDKAMRVLRARLYERELERQRAELDATRNSQIGTGERAEKIRTYNFPDSRVTDHRIKLTAHQLDRVLQGELDEFTEALATDDRRRQLGE
jgi:peptide chain release factor 2